MFTGKQERNGATGSTATQTSAQPGPGFEPIIAAALASAIAKSGYQLPVESAGVVDWDAGVSGGAS